jgi:hypothetical protein
VRLPIHSLSVPALCLGILFLLAGCGGGGGGGDEPPLPSGGWVTITSPTDEPTFTDYCNEAYLSGEAFISPDWSAVGFDGTVITGVTVTWFNAATGGSGTATQQASICYFMTTPYPCDNTWRAAVPMAVGSNQITVTASDPSGRTGTDTITINHPEPSFSVSGTVRTEAGVGLSFRESQLDLTLSDGSTTRRTVTSIDGSYQFSCARSGVPYSVTPSSPIAYEFTPPQQVVQVLNADLSDVDFTTPAWFISGRVLLESGGGVPGILVQVSGTGTVVSQLTDHSGSYRLALPNGTYTLWASDFWGYYTLSPDGWVSPVLINSADVTEQNFLAIH